jgi:hypothetical protein
MRCELQKMSPLQNFQDLCKAFFKKGLLPLLLHSLLQAAVARVSNRLAQHF